MTTARFGINSEFVRNLVAGKLLRVLLVGALLCTSVYAQTPSRHWLHAGAMPPGAIGRQRLLRGGPLSGYCQPVEIRAPQGARIAPVVGGTFTEGRQDALLVGLTLGHVYRFKVTEIPGEPGLELFPTVEVIDRLHPPCGKKLHFPIPIELTRSELIAASEGSFITRVIYLENPMMAMPIAEEEQEDNQRWVEARPGDDPLVIADYMGRPMAIVRLGGRVPEQNEINPRFNYGAPPVQIYDPPAEELQEKAPEVIELSKHFNRTRSK